MRSCKWATDGVVPCPASCLVMSSASPGHVPLHSQCYAAEILLADIPSRKIMNPLKISFSGGSIVRIKKSDSLSFEEKGKYKWMYIIPPNKMRLEDVRIPS